MNNTPLNQVGLQDLIDAVVNLTGAIDGLAANLDSLVVARAETPVVTTTQPAPTAPAAPRVEQEPTEEKPKRRGRKAKSKEETTSEATAPNVVTPPLTTAEMQEANNELIQIATRIGDGGTSIFQIMGELGLRQLADIGTNRPLFNTLMERVRALEA
jgi:hypothetical protein